MLIFEFESKGQKGLIAKLVKYQHTNVKGVFNLAFGDKNVETGEIDDKIISNNGDSEKVLVTVVATLYAFTDIYPDAWVYASGTSKARTRLYRMGISKFLVEVMADFEVLGKLTNDWESFKNNVDYKGYMVRRKRLLMK